MLLRPAESLQADYTAIKTKKDTDYTNNISLWTIYWSQGNIAIRGYAGDPSLQAQLQNTINTSDRNQYYFNRIMPICNMISGYQRRNRKSTIVVPLEMGDQHTADQYSKLMLNIFKRENVYELVSEAFLNGAIITGMNLIQVYMDYTKDPLNGDIKFRNLNYNEYMIDPYFRDTEKLSDCSFILLRSYMSNAAAAAIMPSEYYDRIMSLHSNPSGMSRDGRFQYMPEAFGYTQSQKITYDEYWYRDYREQTVLYDTMTGASNDVSFNDKIDIEAFIADNPQVKLIKNKIPTVKLAIFIQDECFFNGQNPYLIDDYPFIPIVGYYNKSMPYLYSRIQGVVRSLLDPQVLLNRRIILSADLLESQVNSGWIFKENSVVDVKHLFQTGQGRIIPLKDDAQMTDLQAIIPPQIPPSFFQMQETFDNELFNCAGISQENLGKVIQDDASGYLSALRQGAGLTSLQPLFDRLDIAQNMLGNLLLAVIQRNWTPGKVMRLLEGEQPSPQFYDQAFGTYHCQVQASFNTESQIQMQFAQLLELQKAGVPIAPEDLIQAATLQHKDKLIENMQKREQAQQQMQQMQAQAQMQELQSRAELSKARAMADIGLYNERTSRVQENFALAEERRAAAIRDEDTALLNLIKAAKELEGLDIAQLKELVSLHQIVKSQELANKVENQQQGM